MSERIAIASLDKLGATNKQNHIYIVGKLVFLQKSYFKIKGKLLIVYLRMQVTELLPKFFNEN